MSKYAPLLPPPSSNTGGNPVNVDWLAFVFRVAPQSSGHLERVLEMLRGYSRLPFHGRAMDRGWLGYERSAEIKHGDSQVVCKLGWGGESQGDTCFVSFTGGGCSYFTGTQLAAMVYALQGTIRRVDLCCDFLGGEITVDDAVAAYHAGEFSLGARPPSYNCVGDWLKPQGLGRTFYVGKRGNGKQVRAYEKGMQLGDKESPWVRVELELTSRDRVIPLEVLTQPAKYFAGGNSFLERCAQVAGEKIRTIRAALNTSLDRGIAHAKRQFGRLVTLLCHQLRNDSDVVEVLKRPGYPDRYAGQVMTAAYFGVRYQPPVGLALP